MLRDFEGFDYFASADQILEVSGYTQWLWNDFAGVIVRPGRYGYGAGLRYDSPLSLFGPFRPTFAERSSNIGIGLDVQMISDPFSPPADDSLVMLFASSYSANLGGGGGLGGQFVVQFRKTTGSVKIYGGDLGLGEFVPIGPVLFETANNVWSPDGPDGDGWNFFEVRGLVDLLRGFIEVAINGFTVVGLYGIRTQYAADPTDMMIDTVSMGHAWFGNSVFVYDNFYVLDGQMGAGSTEGTDFLGVIRVLAERPITEEGVAWTPLANTNVQEINDEIFDGDVSYNYSQNISDADHFRYPAFPITVSFVAGLKLTGAYRKDDAGLRQVTQFIGFGDQFFDGGVHNLSDTNYVFFGDLWRVSPITNVNFTDLDLNQLVAGYRLVA